MVTEIWQKDQFAISQGKKTAKRKYCKGFMTPNVVSTYATQKPKFSGFLRKKKLSNFHLAFFPFLSLQQKKHIQASRTEKVDKLGYRFICHCLWLCYDHVSFWRQFMCAIIINAFIKPKRTETTHWKRKESRNKWAECP